MAHHVDAESPGHRVVLPPEAHLKLCTSRLALTPLTETDAAELFPILQDPALHLYIGGSPVDLAHLRLRFARWTHRQSPDGAELWLNWVIRLRDTGATVGHLQATIHRDGTAEIAYVVGTAWAGRGIATEAARAGCELLRSLGTHTIRARIHPEHEASMAVARKVGLLPTGRYDEEGEELWEHPPGLAANAPSV